MDLEKSLDQLFMEVLARIETVYGAYKLKTSVIWNISSQIAFPIELWKHPKLELKVTNVPLETIDQVDLTPESIHIFFVNVNKEGWKSISKLIESKYETHPFLSLILIASEDASEEIQEQTKAKSKIVVLENPIHYRELRLILDRAIQAEFYKKAALDIGASCLENVGFFDGVFQLAHQEYEDSKKENEALRGILKYKEMVKKTNIDITSALEKVNELKNQELIELHERMRASETLDELRERELKEARELQQATEKVLSYSRTEEMNMEKIIKAHDRLLDYSEAEIRALLKENKELKAKLGMV
jgi:hypothetical protein